jgi:hypothetical protein
VSPKLKQAIRFELDAEQPAARAAQGDADAPATAQTDPGAAEAQTDPGAAEAQTEPGDPEAQPKPGGPEAARSPAAEPSAAPAANDPDLASEDATSPPTTAAPPAPSDPAADPSRGAPTAPAGDDPSAEALTKDPATAQGAKAAKGAFSELEMAFFEQDLQKVEEVDTFEDLVADEPEPGSAWGRIFNRGGKKSADAPGPAKDKGKAEKKLPRPPHKRNRS